MADDLQNDLDDAIAALEDASVENEDLKQQNSELLSRLDDMESGALGDRGDGGGLRGGGGVSMDDMMDRMAEVQNKLESKVTEATELRNKNQDQKETIEQLTKELQEVKLANVRLEGDKKTAEDAQAELQEKAHAESQQAMAKSKSAGAANKSERANRREVTKLSKENLSLQEEISDLRHDLALSLQGIEEVEAERTVLEDAEMELRVSARRGRGVGGG